MAQYFPALRRHVSFAIVVLSWGWAILRNVVSSTAIPLAQGIAQLFGDMFEGQPEVQAAVVVDHGGEREAEELGIPHEQLNMAVGGVAGGAVVTKETGDHVREPE